MTLFYIIGVVLFYIGSLLSLKDNKSPIRTGVIVLLVLGSFLSILIGLLLK